MKELEQHICEITEEYEDRKRIMKKRFNTQHITTEYTLEDVLNLKISEVPDFIFVRIRSVHSANPLSSKSEKNDILKKFMEYDMYEIEVVDDQSESHYVIERTAYQILGLFTRLKKHYKGHSRLANDYKFPDNLQEILFDKQYCKNDMRQVSMQHYINDVCKQEIFKKCQELAAFLEIARFKTSKQFESALNEIANLEIDSDSNSD